VYYYQPESKRASMLYRLPRSISSKIFKVTPSTEKVMLTVFSDSQGVLLAHFQKRDENINSALFCGVLLNLRETTRRKFPGQLARWVLLHHENARPHTPRSPQERIQELQLGLLEHPPYSQNWLVETSICLVR
jgi:histone-lysine N-methyltransferase SETMAR